MSKESTSSSIAWAQFRFSIIGSLLSRPPATGELRKQLEVLAAQSWRHPLKDKWVTFGVSTIERWYYRALNSDDPVSALARKIRTDAGNSKVISPALLSALKSQYDNYPHWSYKLHSDNLTALIGEQPKLGNAPSYSSVLRRMKQRGWNKKKSKRPSQTQAQKKAAKRLEQYEVRSYESEYVNALWHLDFHKGHQRIVDINGNWHTPVALCVLDDRSRLCCHIQWYLAETAEVLIHGLSQAFHKRGLPRGLMTDNGSAMIAHETKNGLMRLGIAHETTLPYSPYQNGKQESFWSQLEGRLINMLSRVDNLTLDFLNHTSQAWIEMEYNRSRHEEICEQPVERFIKGPNVSRPSPDSETMRFNFSIQEKRIQRKSDGTISLKNKRFEIPSRFRHFHNLHIRYKSWDLSMAYLVDEQTGNLLSRIYPQDKIKNSHGKRRTLEPLPEVIPAEKDRSDPLPPLLRKLMADYAATGLPPAYIPKEEATISNSKKSKENNDE